MALAGVLVCGGVLIAQQISGFDAPTKAPGNVVYKAEAQVVKAGKPAVLELEFVVRDGFHVNSHTPKSELLIPTVIKVAAGGWCEGFGCGVSGGGLVQLQL